MIFLGHPGCPVGYLFCIFFRKRIVSITTTGLYLPLEVHISYDAGVVSTSALTSLWNEET